MTTSKKKYKKVLKVMDHIQGPVIELAGKVKALVDAKENEPDRTLVETNYGNFYVSKIELAYYEGGDSEVVGHLVPNEGDGKTFDFVSVRTKHVEVSD